MEAITHSSILSFKTCRQRYQFRYEMGLVPKARPVYFDLGSAIHLALEMWYAGKTDLEIDAAIVEYFEDNQPAADDIERLAKFDEASRMAPMIWRRYRDQYPRGSEQFKVIATEVEFELPIVNPETGARSQTFTIAGKMDGIVRDTRNGTLWVLEHKTTAALTGLYKKRLTLDAQSLLYVEAAERKYGEPIAGVLYNVIVKAVPHYPKLLKNGELSRDKNQITTPELYRQAILDNCLNEADYAGFLAELEGRRREYFYREVLTFSEQDREQWREELWDIAKDIRQAKLNERWYRNTSQCAPTGGSVCAYFDVCTACDKRAVIEASFTKAERLHTELEGEDTAIKGAA